MGHALLEVNHGPRRGFTLIEFIMAGAAVLVALALLGLMAGRSRKLSQLGESMANLRRIGELTGSYANDYQDSYFGFSWEPSIPRAGIDPDLRQALIMSQSKMQAAAAQVVDLIRRRAGENAQTFPLIPDWVPQAFYGHLVLADYGGMEVPVSWMVSPADAQRGRWTTEREAFRRGEIPNQPAPTTSNLRFMYSSSYSISPYVWQANSGPTFVHVWSGEGVSTVRQLRDDYGIIERDDTVVPRSSHEVRYPSSKAVVWETYTRYFGRREAYFQFPEARCPIGFADGSVRVQTTGDEHRGWNPRLTASSFPAAFLFQPEPWEPTVPGRERYESRTVYGVYRYTRGGLLGRDFYGPEVTTP